MQKLSSEQVLALAPDESARKSGRELAHEHKWQSLNLNQNAICGLQQGSGKMPYKVQVNVDEPAFKCTCPINW